MALYRVRVEGSGFDIKENGGPPLRGFVVAQLVEAQSDVEAEAHVKARVATEWGSGKYGELGIRPKLRITEVKRFGFLGSRFQASGTGYVFHSDAH